MGVLVVYRYISETVPFSKLIHNSLVSKSNKNKTKTANLLEGDFLGFILKYNDDKNKVTFGYPSRVIIKI